MNNTGLLMLQQTRLAGAEEYIQKGEGVTFVLAESDNGNFVTKLGQHSLCPGDVIVFSGLADARLSVLDKSGEFRFWHFSVSFENTLPLLAGDEICLLHHIRETFKTGQIYPANSRLARECQRSLDAVPAEFNLEHRAQLIRIAATVLTAEFKKELEGREGHERKEVHVVEALSKLSASELANLSVPELASRFHCSRRHLNRLFHKQYGISAAALKMEMRLLKAISLLRNSEMKLADVANESGFKHLGLFNKCFKRRFGSSPGKWRRSAGNIGRARRDPDVASGTAIPPDEGKNCPLMSQSGDLDAVALRDIVERGQVAGDGPLAQKQPKSATRVQRCRG